MRREVGRGKLEDGSWKWEAGSFARADFEKNRKLEVGNAQICQID
jgi:hypothetical protein